MTKTYSIVETSTGRERDGGSNLLFQENVSLANPVIFRDRGRIDRVDDIVSSANFTVLENPSELNSEEGVMLKADENKTVGIDISLQPTDTAEKLIVHLEPQRIETGTDNSEIRRRVSKEEDSYQPFPEASIEILKDQIIIAGVITDKIRTVLPEGKENTPYAFLFSAGSDTSTLLYVTAEGNWASKTPEFSDLALLYFTKVIAGNSNNTNLENIINAVKGMKEDSYYSEPNDHPESNSEFANEFEGMLLIADMLGKDELTRLLDTEETITLNDITLTSDKPINNLYADNPAIRSLLVRSCHTGVFQVAPIKGNRTFFTLFKDEKGPPWKPLVYEMTKVPEGNNDDKYGADLYYHPELDYSIEDNHVVYHRLNLCLRNGTPLDQDENRQLKATPFTFVQTESGPVRLTKYWRERIKEHSADTQFAYEEMEKRKGEVRSFLLTYIAGVKSINTKDGMEKANNMLGNLSGRYGIESEGCFYSGSTLLINSDGSFNLTKMPSPGSEDTNQQVLRIFRDENELIDSFLLGIEIAGKTEPIEQELANTPIPILSIDATIALWSQLFSVKYEAENRIHNFHLHAGGGDMGGMPPIYPGYMFHKHGRGTGREDILPEIFETLRAGREALYPDSKPESNHVIMVPARIWDATVSKDDPNPFAGIIEAVVRDKAQAVYSANILESAASLDKITDEELSNMVPNARKVIREFLATIKMYKDPLYPLNKTDAQKLVIHEAVGRDGNRTNEIWRLATKKEPDWLPARETVSQLIPDQMLHRITNKDKYDLENGLSVPLDEIGDVSNLNFCLGELNFMQASLLLGSIRSMYNDKK